MGGSTAPVKVRRAYCSATDRNVPVALKAGARLGPIPSVEDCRVLECLDYGVRCTGALCPLFSFPSSSQPFATGPTSDRAPLTDRDSRGAR